VVVVHVRSFQGGIAAIKTIPVLIGKLSRKNQAKIFSG